MSEAIFAAGLTKADAGKTVVDHLDLSVKRGRHPHGKRPAAGLRHVRSCRALHTPCRPLLPLGINRGRRGTHTPKRNAIRLLSPDRGNNIGGGYPAGASGTSRVFRRCIAGNGSGYHRDFFMLFRFCCLSVLHAPNVGVVNFHRLWCVFGPFYFLFMHHNLLDEEPRQLRR